MQKIINIGLRIMILFIVCWNLVPIVKFFINANINISNIANIISSIMIILLHFITFFSVQQDKNLKLQYLINLILGLSLCYLLKLVINIPRPDLSNNHSFPSGHAASGIIAIVIIFASKIKYIWKILCLLLFIIACYGRVLALKHTWYDIIGAILIILILNIIFDKFKKYFLKYNIKFNLLP